jgi:hypothetical protein
MPVLAFSALDALLDVGLAVAGFIVVAMVCAAVLAALQVVLPSTDSGAAEADRLRPPEEEGGQGADAARLDSEVDA